MIRGLWIASFFLTLMWPPQAGFLLAETTHSAALVHDARRIVSVGGAVTEIVYALGLADRIIAVDSTSRFPAQTATKPDVGYMRRLATEPILALAPTVVLAVEDAGPPAVLDQLREAGIQVVLVPDHPSPRGALDKILFVATALSEQEKGRVLMAGLEAELAALAARIDGLGSRPRVLFLLSVGSGGAPLAAGRDTSAAGIIELAGGESAVTGFSGYKPLSPEALVAAAPDVILVTNRTLDLLGGLERLLQVPTVAQTPAGQTRRVITMDGLLLLGFGPRTGDAVEQLATKLHPNVFQSGTMQ